MVKMTQEDYDYKFRSDPMTEKERRRLNNFLKYVTTPFTMILALYLISNDGGFVHSNNSSFVPTTHNTAVYSNFVPDINKDGFPELVVKNNQGKDTTIYSSLSSGKLTYILK